jgi:uncharacterized protein (TIGR02246 family)
MPKGVFMDDKTKETKMIMELERRWARKLREKDVDWIVNLFADQGRQFPPNAKPVVGSKELRAAWDAMANTDGLEVSWEPEEAHVSASGDMAYDFGTGTITSPDGKTQAAKYLVVWVRQHGKWKVAVDMFNINAP